MGVRGIVVVCALSLVVAAAALAATSANLPQILAAQIVSGRHSGVRVLIPSHLNAYVRASRLVGSGGGVSDGYDIQLSSAPKCYDATACFVAEFWGTPGPLDPLRQHVSLAKGIEGRFRASSCGASCSPATIEWREFGSRYEIQYMGGRSAMIALADSAIAAGPR
jgi:hypothetical protein